MVLVCTSSNQKNTTTQGVIFSKTNDSVLYFCPEIGQLEVNGLTGLAVMVTAYEGSQSTYNLQ